MMKLFKSQYQGMLGNVRARVCVLGRRAIILNFNSLSAKGIFEQQLEWNRESLI
jgi:hypothetical protein